MEHVRNKRLDNLCESIAEHRAAKNDAAVGEQQDIAAALQVMQRDGVSVYRHARVELARVPGAEKLRVRLTKEEGDAGEADLAQGHADTDEESEGRSDVEDALEEMEA